MEGYFREPVIKEEGNYPKVIMPEEKDKIVNELINQKRNGFSFEYKDVPNLNISKVQFERVMIELENLKKTVDPSISEEISSKVRLLAEIVASITSALNFVFGRI